MDEADKVVLWLSIGILVVLLFVLDATISQYQHPMPAKECRPYIYPICFRAQTPDIAPQASTVAVYLSILLVVLLAMLLIYVSYHACVIEQKTLVTNASEIAPPTAQPTQGVDSTKVQ